MGSFSSHAFLGGESTGRRLRSGGFFRHLLLLPTVGDDASPVFHQAQDRRLVEWTWQNLRDDQPGYIPVELEIVLDCYGLDAANWSQNVKRYGMVACFTV